MCINHVEKCHMPRYNRANKQARENDERLGRQMAKSILVFGSFVADLTGRSEKFPVPGETVLGSSFVLGPGGKGSNQAVAAHRAGANMRFISKLGTDAFGSVAKAFYEAEGMDTRYLLEDKEHATGAALIMVNEKTGQNMIMVIIGACGCITREDVEACRESIAGADYLLVQLEINLDALSWVIEIAHESGTKVILNPAPAQALPDELLAKVYAVTPNETEAFTLTGVEVTSQATARQAAEAFLRKGVQQVVITLGSQGVYCTDGEREATYPCIPVQAVDTTGAGDAFNGGFVTALARGWDLFQAAKYGNCAGALSVTRKGTAPAMPYQAEIEELFAKTYGQE